MTVFKRKKKQFIGKACKKTRIAFDGHWHSSDDDKCQQEPETKNNRERRQVFAEQSLSIFINSVKWLSHASSYDRNRSFNA